MNRSNHQRTHTFLALLLLLATSLLVACSDSGGGGDTNNDALDSAPAPGDEQTNADTALTPEAMANREASEEARTEAATPSTEPAPTAPSAPTSAFPNPERKVLAVGDSNTTIYGNVTTPWPDRLELQLGSEVFRRGVIGDTSIGTLSRLPGYMADLQPTHVLIMVGTNDILFNQNPPEVVLANIGAMIDIAVAGGAQSVVVGSLPPLLLTDAEAVANRLTVDQGIPGVAQSRGAKVARVSEAIGAGAGTMQADGIHLNDAGHAVTATVFAGEF